MYPSIRNNKQKRHRRYTRKCPEWGDSHFCEVLFSCLLMTSMRLAPVTRPCARPPCCCSRRFWSCRWGEPSSCGGRREPVGATLLAMSQKSRLALLLMKVIAVPFWPSRPALPTCKETKGRLRSVPHHLHDPREATGTTARRGFVQQHALGTVPNCRLAAPARWLPRAASGTF